MLSNRGYKTGSAQHCSVAEFQQTAIFCDPPLTTLISTKFHWLVMMISACLFKDKTVNYKFSKFSFQFILF
jgi:hypothetical protein